MVLLTDLSYLPPTVRAVLFDAVGTLVHPEPSVAMTYRRVGSRLGSSLPVGEVDARFRSAFARQEQLDRQSHGLRTDEERERKRWRAIVAEVLSEVDDQGQAFDTLWDHFGRAEHWRVDPDAATVWAQLTARGLMLGLASNFDRRLEQICRDLKPLDTTAHVFSSSSVGWRKPSIEFFRAIEARLNLAPDQLLLVGDDWENDYCAAQAAGWHTIFFDPQHRSSNAARVGCLRELLTESPLV